MVSTALKTIRVVKEYFNLECDVRIVIEEDVNEWAWINQIAPGEYEIEVSPELIDRASEDELIETIAHEMVHVKQHELDGLDMGLEYTMFKGVQYETKANYWFQPWEIEARGYEKAFLARMREC